MVLIFLSIQGSQNINDSDVMIKTTSASSLSPEETWSEEQLREEREQKHTTHSSLMCILKLKHSDSLLISLLQSHLHKSIIISINLIQPRGKWNHTECPVPNCDLIPAAYHCTCLQWFGSQSHGQGLSPDFFIWCFKKKLTQLLV